jgi:hypothetical protein
MVTQATVIETTHREDADESGAYEYYGITYGFAYGGSRYTRSVGVSKSVYHSLKEGDTVTIVYIPNEPTISRLEGSYEEPSAMGFVVLGCAVLALVLLFVAVYALSRVF